MKAKAVVVARVLLGLMFLVPALLFFSGKMPHNPMPDAATRYMAGLAASGYTMYVVKVVELLAGIALIAGQFVPLALVMLAPIVVNIALFHLVLAPNYGLVVFMVALEGFVAWSYRDAFRGVLARTAQPAA
ncbi:MAG: DoxX family membrane protein [Polyangiales bacterium]